MIERNQLFKLSPSATKHKCLFWASEKDTLSSANPLLLFTNSQDHPQSGLWKTVVFA